MLMRKWQKPNFFHQLLALFSCAGLAAITQAPQTPSCMQTCTMLLALQAADLLTLNITGRYTQQTFSIQKLVYKNFTLKTKRLHLSVLVMKIHNKQELMNHIIFKSYHAAYTHKSHAFSATAIVKIQLNTVRVLSVVKIYITLWWIARLTTSICLPLFPCCLWLHGAVYNHRDLPCFHNFLFFCHADKSRENCNFLQLVFDPVFSPTLGQAAGDLDSRIGKVKVAGDPRLQDSSFTSVYHDSGLTSVTVDLLSGQRSLYLVIFDASHHDSFLACAKIREIHPVILK